jgi:hypothetical protein
VSEETKTPSPEEQALLELIKDYLAREGMDLLPTPSLSSLITSKTPNMSFAGEIPSKAMSYEGPATISESGAITPASEPFTVLGQTPSLLGNWSSGAGFGAGGYGAGNLVGPLFGAKRAYDLFSSGSHANDPRHLKRDLKRGAQSGALIGSYFGPAGAAIGAGIGGLSGLIKTMTGGKKSKDQYNRDEVRKQLEALGIASKINGSHHVTLSDGSKFNIGLDGKTPVYKMDLNNKLVQDLIPYVLPLSYTVVGRNDKESQATRQKKIDDLTGYLVNAAISNAGGDIEKAKANIKGFYKINIDPSLFPEEQKAVLNQKLKEMIPEPSMPSFNFGGGGGGGRRVIPNFQMPNLNQLIDKYVNPYLGQQDNQFSSIFGGK